MDRYISKHTGAQLDGAVDTCSELQVQVGVLSGNVASCTASVAALNSSMATLTGRVQSIENALPNKVNSTDLCTVAGERVIGDTDLNPNWHVDSYQNIKGLRDGSKLIPGRWYLIADYIATVNTKNYDPAYVIAAYNTQARTPTNFGVLVLALTENTFSEQAYAVKPKSNYFAENNLSAWKLWYCIDNDVTRFDWADSVNGLGVIYRMIDEFGNDCPYDFKGIKTTDKFFSKADPMFTFTDNYGNDASLVPTQNCHHNFIAPIYRIDQPYTRTLNCIIFQSVENKSINCYNNYIGPGCARYYSRENNHDNILKGNSQYVTVPNGSFAFSTLGFGNSYMILGTSPSQYSQLCNIHSGLSGASTLTPCSISLPIGEPGENEICPIIGGHTYPITITVPMP